MRAKLLRGALAVLVSCALLGLVLAKLDTRTAWERILGADLGWIGVSALLSAGVLVLRGLRFSALMQRPDPGAATAAVAGQGFLTRVTPFRLGELVMPYVLGRYADEDAAHTLVALLLVRLVDLCLIAGAGAIAAMAFSGPSESWRGVAVLLVVALSALLLTFRTWMRLGIGLAAWGVKRLGLTRVAMVARIVARLEGMSTSMARLTRRQQLAVAGWSLAIFVVQTVLLGTLPRAFGVQLAPLQLLVGASAAQIGAALPVASVGSIGTLEAAWVAGFMWVGVSQDDAVFTAIAAQVLTLAYSAAFAAVAWIYLDRRGPSPTASPPR